MLVKTLSLLFAQPLLNLLEAENVTLVGADLKWILAVVVKSVATRKNQVINIFGRVCKTISQLTAIKIFKCCE